MQSTTPCPIPFEAFAAGLAPQTGERAAITADYRRAEHELVGRLLDELEPPPDNGPVMDLAWRLASTLRDQAGLPATESLAQMLLQEFSLSSEEGIALMCLAESVLRIPDTATQDALIRDKISKGRWSAHLGHSPSPFVNAAIWGLLLTGRLYAAHQGSGLQAALAGLVEKGGEPLVRRAVDAAMRLLGDQFVAGRTVEQALDRSRAQIARGYTHSYDMLGEAAMTEADALRYTRAYEQAIHLIGASAKGGTPREVPGISIKLSALHPRYTRNQKARVLEELYPRLLSLARAARGHGLGINIDAEETARLDLSLDLLERLCGEPDLAEWDGLGFVVQAYQKRSLRLIDHLTALARRSGHRLMIRLVKGAYWDSEIKLAQVQGLPDYPVYTRKPHTDIAYLACARKLLAAPDAVFPQFATHNAHTVAAIYHLAGPADFRPGQYEFQCLHGMGEPLYDQIVGTARNGGLDRPCRIYAPVGPHDTLLAYLVRRLLENGANTSFVHRVADRELPLEAVVVDPVAAARDIGAGGGPVGAPDPRIALPPDLYGAERANSQGLDWSDEASLLRLSHRLAGAAGRTWLACPLLDDEVDPGPRVEIRNPAHRGDLVGHVQEASPADLERALTRAAHAVRLWRDTAPAERAAVLRRAANGMEEAREALAALMVREAGKTLPNAFGEVRETIDFLRYYAARATDGFDSAVHRPLGIVACISPWNFPLSIFTGQVAAALAAGNTVVAKPAEQTPLVAAESVRILRAAGVPPGALQMLPGRGESVGAGLVADGRVQGVLFTGSVAVARDMRRVLAERLGANGRSIPLIAETGGLNAMIVDSSALPEQVVADVMESAFDSAGQRCSALRLLCLQEDIADRVLAMLRGAMDEYRTGRPDRLDTDAGPVIDEAARDDIEGHVAAMLNAGRPVYRAGRQDPDECRHGCFVAPTLIELERPDQLRREVFGPVLHVVRFAGRRLDRLLEQVNALGYGLTLGLHTRIDETVALVLDRARVGNIYVNRNMIGAVVGVQPFGGEGLSGTGPKAGGPLYLPRLLSAAPPDTAIRALAAHPPAPAWLRRDHPARPLAALWDWARAQGMEKLARRCGAYAARLPESAMATLPGPTGQLDVYALRPRGKVLCVADEPSDLLAQLAAVLATGNDALWQTSHEAAALHASLPADIARHVAVADPAESPFDAVLVHAVGNRLKSILRQLARRAGPIVPLIDLAPGDAAIPLERLLVERSVSINTAAAGGNASLMAMA
ncbi:trifunctional transcriptional regulator/proline dehydrogenase/L-glutamate gamma-semialdehyde dehydrogenase [Pigmentiphaga sp.]|uniref:trifunctional transcriptional regulator/proline dehydrogenase/L-glutamate gamma-semialdehyde dehydrogenase n=1 Tax=Pigmentiphaga sp. TaxID=1977564 RepID=UPI00128B43FF|nr:trifunctional transcriptional regulator/proline dehydrogenase/L-glutamate gamma-semialdehyde dehydrogenase [Pigmentiphaga sp.]MPS26745.1 trifunctional transcriptional regulator/proline dehydrogenase/L-glutamate gamma-semialdehyde dehydrogenase [Alcaligenaceae bacterium SAGV5]MPS53771.1 trifunctional transcriptional regulator/proline dehydrogenase/L-glutamate gamma-semialdehyde dehydrogenase [Alcaligenaceae bacterium SAGV3]MPT59917.1 trifunctional transcriptional regulator/proline dehydrogenas